MSATTLEEAKDAIQRIFDEVLEGPALDVARAWATEIGIRDARRGQDAAVANRQDAQATYRGAQASEQMAQEAFDAAVSEAEWTLGDSFVPEGNKTFLVIANGEKEPIKRQMTADEKREWLSREARKQPAVVEALAALRKAKDVTATARDELSHADVRISAVKHDIDSRTAELYLLAAALPRKVTL